MLHISKYFRFLKSIAFIILIAGLAAAQAPAGPRRPAAVPAGYVITPFGYFHPSCVAHLAKGDEVRHDLHVIQHANRTSTPTHACAYPHYTADGARLVGDERSMKDPTISNAWVEYASITTTTSYGSLYADWNVPSAPTNNDGQTLYFFNGLEDSSDVVTIIQPVLGWNADFASAWGIAAWNCCESGTTYEGTPALVNSGDLIQGILTDTCSAGTLSCATWDVGIFDLTNNQLSLLLETSSFGQTFNWAFGGVLEVYNIVQCGDYPAGGGSTTFYAEGLEDYNFNAITAPAWKVTKASKRLSPQCNYGASLPKQITLDY